MKDNPSLVFIGKDSGETKSFSIKHGVKQIMKMIPMVFIDRDEYNKELENCFKTQQIPDLKRAKYEILMTGLVWIE